MAQHKEGGGGAVDAQSCDRPLSNCRVSQARIFFSFSPLVSREHNVGRFEDKCGFVGCARRIFWASDVQGYTLARRGGGGGILLTIVYSFAADHRLYVRT